MSIVLIQTSLLCGCGDAEILRAGMCKRCHRRARLSREEFAGLREFVLQRDHHQCQTCGETNESKLLVHHRKPDARTARQMITSCRRCHPRIHFTNQPSVAFASLSLLRRLWREANPKVPEQKLLLEMLADDGVNEQQATLWIEEGEQFTIEQAEKIKEIAARQGTARLVFFSAGGRGPL